MNIRPEKSKIAFRHPRNVGIKSIVSLKELRTIPFFSVDRNGNDLDFFHSNSSAPLGIYFTEKMYPQPSWKLIAGHLSSEATTDWGIFTYPPKSYTIKLDKDSKNGFFTLRSIKDGDTISYSDSISPQNLTPSVIPKSIRCIKTSASSYKIVN